MVGAGLRGRPAVRGRQREARPAVSCLSGGRRSAKWGGLFLLPVFLLCAPGATCETGGPSWPGGIGAVLGHSSEEGRLVVREVPPDGPAAAAGLEPGDEIVAIDGREVAGMSVREVVAALRGEVGSRVRLRVRRGEDERDVEVLRAPYRD